MQQEFAIDGPMSPDVFERALGAARLAGLAKIAPFSLSLGEQRRLTIATTLRRTPNILLLDEPFIGQDRHNVAWIIAQILAARERGAATVLVSHDVPLVASLCDRVLYLGEDAIVGDPNTVFSELTLRGQAAFTPGYWEGKDT